MTRKSFLLVLCAAAGLVIGAGQAQAKPNFSGEWKLNIAKSEFGPMPGPEKMTDKIDHKDPAINVKRSQVGGPQGDVEMDQKYLTDGTETTNTFGPMESKSTAKWDGDVLVVSTKLAFQGMDLDIKTKWSLSADGKTLTQDAHINTPQGEVDIKYVFEKQ